MKSGITIAFLSLGLIACGGESNNSNNNRNQSPQASIDTAFAQDFHGLQAAPTLTTADVTEGDSVELNSEVSGHVLEDSSVNLTFTAEKSGLMMLHSTSEAHDVKLTVTEPDTAIEVLTTWGALRDTSGDEQILTYQNLFLFPATEGLTYTIEIQSAEGATDFILTLADANREYLALNRPEEYIVSETYIEERACDFFDDRDLFIETTYSSETYHAFSRMNWKAGYHSKGLHHNKITGFNNSIGEFTLTFDDQDRSLSYGVDFETGKVFSSESTSKTYINDVERTTEKCAISINMTGEIVL